MAIQRETGTARLGFECPRGHRQWSFAYIPDGSPGMDHTAVRDAREVYLVSEPGTDTAGGRSARDTYYNGPDGKNGPFKVTYNGNRFVTGSWPEEDPPIYPSR